MFSTAPTGNLMTPQPFSWIPQNISGLLFFSYANGRLSKFLFLFVSLLFITELYTDTFWPVCIVCLPTAFVSNQSCLLFPFHHVSYSYKEHSWIQSQQLLTHCWWFVMVVVSLHWLVLAKAFCIAAAVTVMCLSLVFDVVPVAGIPCLDIFICPVFILLDWFIRMCVVRDSSHWTVLLF